MGRAIETAIAQTKAKIASEMKGQGISDYEILVDRRDSGVKGPEGNAQLIETNLCLLYTSTSWMKRPETIWQNTAVVSKAPGFILIGNW